ncbi:MAG: hypothetical protein RR394_08750 [Oscillospiraceae bacterium]
MRENGYWVIRTYEAGTVGEKIKYWVSGEKPRKSARRLKSDIQKIQQNEASSVKRAARLLNENFTHNDVLLGLDYSDEGISLLMKRLLASGIDFDRLDEQGKLIAIKHEAERDLNNFIRRCKRAMPEGSEFKYFAITSDMDGESGATVRIHHHLTISGGMLDICKLKWNLGSVDYENIWDEPDHSGLAEYLIKQVRHVPDDKKYKPSRNLVNPQPRDRIAVNGSELRVPLKCSLLHRNEFKPGRPQYIRYILPASGFVDSAGVRAHTRQLFGNENGGHGSGRISHSADDGFTKTGGGENELS